MTQPAGSVKSGFNHYIVSDPAPAADNMDCGTSFDLTIEQTPQVIDIINEFCESVRRHVTLDWEATIG